MSKRHRKKQRQQQRANLPAAQKTEYGTFWGPGTTGVFTGGGVTGRNTNLSRTEWGAATAYQIVPEVNRAITLRSAAISALNWEIVKRGDNGKDEILCTSEETDPHHPLARAFNATYDYSNQSLIALMCYSHDLVGEVYVQKTWTPESGRGLFWLNPLGTEPIIAGDIKYFMYTAMDGGISEQLKPREVAYYHNRNPYSNFRGQGLTQVVMKKVNMARNLDDFIEDFFNNNARPSVLVSPPGDMPFTDQQITQLQQQLDNFLKGRGNNWSTYVSKIGAKYTPMDQPNIGDHYGIAPVLSRYIYTVFGVPLAIAGDDSGTQYKTGDDVQVAFYQNTIIPLARELARYINTQIMPYFDNSGAFFRFDTSEFDLVSADDDLRSQIATRNYQAGLWTRNRGLEYIKQDVISPNDFLLIEGVPIPLDAVADYWKYKLTVSPAPQMAPAVGEDLDIQGAEDVQIGAPQPAAQLTDGATLTVEPTEQPAQINGKATQVTPEDELRAWEKKVSKNPKAKFEPLHTRGDLADWITESLTSDTPSIKTIFDTARQRLMFKAIQATRLDFENDFDDLLTQAREGGMDKRTFSASLRYLLNKFGRKAYLDGLQDGGVDTDELDDEDKATIATMLADQSQYVTDLANAVYKTDTVTDAVADIKAAMWFNKSIDPFYQAATLSADGNSMREWVLGKTEDHCGSCGALAGGRHRYKEYAKRGWLPRASQLACEGFQCDCQLVKVKGRARGRWPVVAND